jgi:acyl carrier protein
MVSNIWAEVLGVERVGASDNFFDLGGNSLLLVKAHSRLQESFAREISMVELFRRATVSSLAEYLSGGQDGGGQPKLQQAQGRASKQVEATKSQRQLMKERAEKFQRGRQQQKRVEPRNN